MAKAGKSGVIEAAPNSQTLQFGGLFINVSALARVMNLSISAMSKKLSGKRPITLVEMRTLAKHLDMSLDEFSAALEDRISLEDLPAYKCA